VLFGKLSKLIREITAVKSFKRGQQGHNREATHEKTGKNFGDRGNHLRFGSILARRLLVCKGQDSCSKFANRSRGDFARDGNQSSTEEFSEALRVALIAGAGHHWCKGVTEFSPVVRARAMGVGLSSWDQDGVLLRLVITGAFNVGQLFEEPLVARGVLGGGLAGALALAGFLGV
jgi:hypothetical protein